MLIDTSGWLCVLDENDRRYEDANRFYRTATRRLTHSYVIAELVPLAQRRGFSRERTLEFIETLFDDPNIKIMWVDIELTREANSLLRDRSDKKKWSLCDAVSFVLMDELKISEALTTDHHFEQAGFVKLLDS